MFLEDERGSLFYFSVLVKSLCSIANIANIHNTLFSS